MPTKHREASQPGAASMEVGSEVTVVRSNRVVLDNTICPAEIIICNGKIANILPRRSWAWASGEKVLDVGDLVVMPGITDPHIHTCEPGHTAWEGSSSAAKAAAARGVTTLVDMPQNCLSPTTTVENLEAKLQSAKGQFYVDVAFWGGVVPGNQDELPSMLQAGVPGFPCSLIASEENEFPHVCLHDVHMAMNELQGTDCVLLEQLWSALREGLIDMVVSAHTPCSPGLKLLNDGDFFKARGGIASLQFGLPLFWTSAKSRGFSLHDVVQLMCQNPASLSRLDHRKGALCPGMDADLVVWDPDKEFELTPYLGFQLHGELLATLVRGRLVYLKGKFSPKPEGDLLVTQRKMFTRGTASPYY